jgi:hypothetical protein
MRAHMFIATVFTVGASFAFGTSAMSADLPQSGIIKGQGTYKGTAQVVSVGEKHFMGTASNWGINYNEAGSGPLHMGTGYCTVAFNNINRASTDVGDCAFGDPGGADKVFVAYSGKWTDNVGGQGGGPITGGIGKYAGIEGKWMWQCKDVDNAQSLIACTYEFDYRLKSATN